MDKSRCPECGATWPYEPGKKGKCPKCQTVVVLAHLPNHLSPSDSPQITPASEQITHAAGRSSSDRTVTSTSEHITSKSTINYTTLATEIWRTMPERRIARVIANGILRGLFEIAATGVILVMLAAIAVAILGG